MIFDVPRPVVIPESDAQAPDICIVQFLIVKYSVMLRMTFCLGHLEIDRRYARRKRAARVKHDKIEHIQHRSLERVRMTPGYLLAGLLSQEVRFHFLVFFVDVEPRPARQQFVRNRGAPVGKEAVSPLHR